MNVLIRPQIIEKAALRRIIRPFWVIPAAGVFLAFGVGVLVGEHSPILGGVTLLGLLGAVALLFSAEAAVLATVLTITLLPFGTLPLDIVLSPTFLDIFLGILIVRWGARRLHPLSPPAPDTPVNLFLWLWLGVALVALLAASGRTPLTGDTLHTFVKIVLATLFFFSVLDVVRTHGQVKRLLAVFCFSTTVAALIGLVLYFLPHPTAQRLLDRLGILHYPTGSGVLRFRVDFNHAERATSTSIDPNIFGGLLMLANLFLIGQLFAHRPLWPRWLSMSALVPMMLVQLLTYSRSSWVSLVVGMTVLGILRYRKLLLFGLIALMLFFTTPASHRFARQLISGLEAKDQAAAMRLGEAKNALQLISAYPALGVGFGGSPDINFYVGVSNIFLLMAEEMGIPGLVIFLTILAIMFFWSLMGLKLVRDPPLFDVLVATIAAQAGIITAGNLDRYFFSYQSDVALVWLVLALSAVIIRIGREVAIEQYSTPVARPVLRVGALTRSVSTRE